MPKNIVQDVVPQSNRRSIRDIPLSRSQTRSQRDDREEREREYDEEEREDLEAETLEYESRRGEEGEEEENHWEDTENSTFPRWAIWIVGFVAFAFLVYVVSNIFSGATITVTAKTQSVPVGLNVTAKLKPVDGEISYVASNLTRDKELTVPAEGQKKVESRATGKIVIYNNYSTTPQRLVKNTRFETPDGLIYKIADSITIPGKTVVSQKSTPGSIEVSVFAESAGAEYNIGLTDFTIPGFKSNPQRYSNFYAKSKTPMTGGKIGVEKTISSSNLEKARATLDSEILQSLTAEMKSVVKEGYTVFEDGYKYNSELVSTVSDSAKNTVTVKERVNFTIYYIKKAELEKYIAQNSIQGYDNLPVKVLDLDKLSFKVDEKNNSGANLFGNIQFSLKGNVNIIWDVNSKELVKKLAGKEKKSLASIVGDDPTIVRVDALIWPFWSRTFPGSEGKIKVVVK